MGRHRWNLPLLALLLLLLLFLCLAASAQTLQSDVLAMQALKNRLTLPSSLDWSNADPCNWPQVMCTGNRVVRIQIGMRGVSGTLPPDISKLTALTRFEVMDSQFSGPLPSFAGLAQLQVLFLNRNNFTFIPADFFTGMSSLQAVDLSYNDFAAWGIPFSLKDCTSLQNFTATQANVIGQIPDFINAENFPKLFALQLSFNNLEGGLPASFAGLTIQILWLNGKTGNSKLNGTIDVITSMTQLAQVWLHSNQFTGPIPDVSNLKNLWEFSLRDNQLTGVVPESLAKLPNLKRLDISYNNLSGKVPTFRSDVNIIKDGNPNLDKDIASPASPTLSTIARGVAAPLTSHRKLSWLS